MWKEIVLKVLSGEKNIPSPFHPDGIIKHVFVMIQPANRMGYLWLWCSKTNKGFNLSRLAIPNGITYYFPGELEKLNIPNIVFDDPEDF
jgi:hypothetical protein